METHSCNDDLKDENNQIIYNEKKEEEKNIN